MSRLDAQSTSELLNELSRRVILWSHGLCDYCGRAVDPTIKHDDPECCRLPERHRGVDVGELAQIKEQLELCDQLVQGLLAG